MVHMLLESGGRAVLERERRCFRPVLHMRIFFLKVRPVFLPICFPKLGKVAGLTFLKKYDIILKKDSFPTGPTAKGQNGLNNMPQNSFNKKRFFQFYLISCRPALPYAAIRQGNGTFFQRSLLWHTHHLTCDIKIFNTYSVPCVFVRFQ